MHTMLELGNAFSEMSLAGDGDGKHFDEAMSIFREFKEKYPNLTENEFSVRLVSSISYVSSVSLKRTIRKER